MHATGSGGLARSQLASLWIKDHPGQGSLPLHALESSKVPRATIDCFLDACADIVQTRHVPTAAPPPSSSASMCGAGSGGLHIFARGLPRRVNDPPPPPQTNRRGAHTHTCSPQQHNPRTTPWEVPGTTPHENARDNASAECPGQRLRGSVPCVGSLEGHGWCRARTLEQSSVASTAAHAAAARPFPEVEQT